MSTELSAAPQLPAMAAGAVSRVAELEKVLSTHEQVDVGTQHTFHAGVYARTILLPKDAVITGALIKIPTLLLVSGDVLMYTGENVVRLTGHHVIEGHAGRKQAMVALADTSMTMVFATAASSIDAAEQEFTDEYEKLTTRKEHP